MKQGFTLFELLLAISILSILILSSVVTYRHVVLQNQLIFTVDRMVSALRYARIQAINEKMPVVLCPNQNNTTCGKNWQNGLLVTDLNHHLFHIVSPFSTGFHIAWRSSLGDNDSIEFQSDGLTHGQQGSFLICGPFGRNLSAKIIVLRTGRVRSEMNHQNCERHA